MPNENSQELPEVSIAIISATLLAATVVVFQSVGTLQDALRLTVSLTVVTLTLATLTSLWHRFRWPRRRTLFRAEAQKLSNNWAGKLNQFNTLTLVPLAQRLVQGRIAGRVIDDPTQMRAHFDAAFDEAQRQLEPITSTLMSAHLNDIAKLEEKCFRSPLDEPWSRFKFLLDIGSHKTRFVFFALGVVSFAASVVFRLYSGGAP